MNRSTDGWTTAACVCVWLGTGAGGCIRAAAALEQRRPPPHVQQGTRTPGAPALVRTLPPNSSCRGHRGIVFVLITIIENSDWIQSLDLDSVCCSGDFL